MKDREQDILRDLKELKEMPYSIPEGYFEDFKKDVTRYAHPIVYKTSIFQKLVPLMYFAAMFAFIAVLGHIFLKNDKATEYAEEEYAEEYIIFSDDMTELAIYNYKNGMDDIVAEIDEEDIIEYLIYTGVSAEEIELSK